MQLIDATNAEDYLRTTGRIAAHESVRVRELTGGVSNMVLLVERSAPAESFVVKQARAQLRTKQAWYSNVERIWREADVLRACSLLLERVPNILGDETLRAQTPRILFEDRENYLLAMTAATQPNVVWKAELLAGQANSTIAAACGTLLATLHGGSWNDVDIARQFKDRTLFHELRVDPYYRHLAVARPETAPAIEKLIASLEENPRCLVHADFSPKNLLVFSGGLMMVDFETGHFGDPAFDLGFFLSHLLLKACYHRPRAADYLDLATAFTESYDRVLSPQVPADELAKLWSRAIQNLAGCAWARLDGKSPVEYLSDEDRRERVRTLCRTLFATSPHTWPEVQRLTQRAFDD